MSEWQQSMLEMAEEQHRAKMYSIQLKTDQASKEVEERHAERKEKMEFERKEHQLRYKVLQMEEEYWRKRHEKEFPEDAASGATNFLWRPFQA